VSAATPAPPLQEIKNLSMSLNSLKVAQARFTESANSLAALPSDGQGACRAPRRLAGGLAPPPASSSRAPLSPARAPLCSRAGREALIPLTPSLFVPATLGGPEEVLVDVGTGFFVGKPAPAATALLRARAEAVGGEVASLARVLAIKESNREVIAQHVAMREGEGEGAPARG